MHKGHLPLSLLLLMGGCGPSPKLGVPVTPTKLDGFKALSFPRTEIPIGATWIEGVGPNGDGADEKSLVVRSGMSSFSLTESQKLGLTASVSTMLGISSSAGNSLNVSYEDLKVQSVKDISNFSQGQRVLYEGLKAGTIIVTYSSGLDATVKASLEKEKLPYNAEMTGSDKSTLKINGSNLFLAYRVVSLGGGSPSSTVKKFSMGSSNSKLDLGNYEFTFPISTIQDCQCTQVCKSDMSVNVRNYSAIDWQGKPYETNIPIDVWQTNPSAPLKLNSSGESGQVLTDFVEINIDNVVVEFGGKVHRMSSPKVCGTVKGDIRLTSARFAVQSVLSPSAPGW